MLPIYVHADFRISARVNWRALTQGGARALRVRDLGLGRISRYLATAKERILRKYPINLIHQFKRLSIHPNGCIVDRRTADLEQLALARKAQIGVFFTDHLAAFAQAHRFSPCDKNRSPPRVGQSSRGGPLSRRPYSQPHQPYPKTPLDASNRLPLPCAHLRRVELALGCRSCLHAAPKAPKQP